MHQLMISFALLFFVGYRYLKNYPDLQNKYLNPHLFDIFGLIYGFIYFNFIILGSVFMFQ
jgi:hypothetical protein